ncbi:PaaI family thioesterase [Sphingomonas sp. R-74633]|uniref:PaaI family thioesterase n=1 Tax=Sphingomonas sp. R-74633 TaxID=2751188 RepID=UPI0015D0F8AD|nr:PaaI family thioesterase [Sphingomonas sp. R-74633]NYT41367.1 PaaI family thioesterase [Sphingomonas sp. R-74633]
MSETAPSGFDVRRFFSLRYASHGSRLGVGYRAHGADWAELELPYHTDMIGDPASGVLASGPILALMDMATATSVWLKAGAFVHQATLDLRIDYLRPATPGRTVIGRGECYRLTRSIAFVRGQAHDGDPENPLAHVAGTFMAIEGYR